MDLFVFACTSGPAAGSAATAARTPEADAAAFVNAMKPRRERKPVVVVLARNEATETTNFLLTHAVLQRSGLVDLHAFAPKRGRVSRYGVCAGGLVVGSAGLRRRDPMERKR